ncbi:hypothetical protein [Streptomyces brevispora]|uniref:Uncharacterized protein n=2 Tax=Streptomyces brevispora TaxID=887462 RepID=A0ABZ1FW18_9ACTN|nr:hypothetical protein [Streptomyces brevispora]WSC11800.1 hypothetical protein OIE64_02225 [Streptomyces brevispora]
MNTAPENMSSRTAAAWIVVLTVLGGATGFAWGGPFLAVACGLSLGSGGAVGAVLSRRRMVGADRESRGKDAVPGDADGAAEMMILGIHAYKVSVFPLAGPGAVTPAERMARREDAYRLTAADRLTHHVREAAAATLEAIDGGSEPAALSAVENLMEAVQEQRCDR